MNKSKKCIVKGCLNHHGAGTFVGDLCSPCYSGLTTGRYGPSACFVRQIQLDSDELNRLRADYEDLQDRYDALERDYENLGVLYDQTTNGKHHE